MGCKTRKYSDGGKIVDREYGNPTFAKSVAEKVGVGDGYSYFPTKDRNAKQRMSISNVTEKLPDVIAKRKKMLDDL